MTEYITNQMTSMIRFKEILIFQKILTIKIFNLKFKYFEQNFFHIKLLIRIFNFYIYYYHI